MNGHFMFMQGMMGQGPGQTAPVPGGGVQGGPNEGQAKEGQNQEADVAMKEAQGASQGGPPGGGMK